MLLQFPFIRRQKLTRELLFSASIHLKSKCLGRKRLNLLMEKDYSPATGIFSSSFTLEQSFSIPRQNMQLHEAAAALHYEVSGNHWQSFRTRVLLASPSPPPLAIRNSFYTASCVNRWKLISSCSPGSMRGISHPIQRCCGPWELSQAVAVCPAVCVPG